MTSRNEEYAIAQALRYGMGTTVTIQSSTISRDLTGGTSASKTSPETICQLVAGLGRMKADNHEIMNVATHTVFLPPDTVVSVNDTLIIDSVNYLIVAIPSDSVNIYTKVYVKTVDK